MKDFNQELFELKQLAGLGQGIYDTNKSPAKPSAGVGDGLAASVSVGISAGEGMGESIEEELDEAIEQDGTNSNKKVKDIDPTSYFPNGEHGDVSDEAGPASAKQGDNPLQKKLKEGYKSLLADLQSEFKLMESTSYSAAQKCACGSTNCTLHESELICDDCGAKVKTDIDNDEAYKV